MRSITSVATALSTRRLPIGDAALRAVVDRRSLAVIARNVAFGSAIGHVQLAPAMTATEQPGEQSFAPAHGTAARPALAVCVIADQALIPLERIPLDIALMVDRDQISQFDRSTRKPRTTCLRPFAILVLLVERPYAYAPA
jgi:hypothetical protein